VSRIEEALRRSGATGARPLPDPDEPGAAAPPLLIDASDAGVEPLWDLNTAPPQAEGSATGGEPDARPTGLLRPAATLSAEKLVVTAAIPRVSIEQYRRLAATLHHAQEARGIRTVLVASALAEEGKTLTATNLALTLSESYRRRVLLVDADLRQPSLHKVFQVPNTSGLSDGLAAFPERKLSLVQLSPLLSLLPGGAADPDPMGALTSARMRRIVTEAAAAFDWVIIDTPPVGLLPDANLLAAMVDAALLVVRAGRTPFAVVQKAVEAVGRDRVLGIVLNAVEPGAQRHSDDYAYYYARYTGSKGGQAP
jgi:capsular exopolysaccharide synthesis family protein